MKTIKKIKRELTFGEEVANAVSHGGAAFLMMVLSPFIAVYIYEKSGGNMLYVSSMIVFCLSIICMLLSSMIYHIMEHKSKHKKVLKILDHIFIYVAIAGSYTPIALNVIGGRLGITLVIIQWLMVIFGILYKSLVKKSMPKTSMAIYIIMGWLAVIILPRLYNTSLIMLALIFLGGLFYTIGAILYTKEFKYAHFVWHMFVLLGVITHLITNIFLIEIL